MTQRDYQFNQLLDQSYAPLHPVAKQRFRRLGVFVGDLPFTRKFLYTFWDVDGNNSVAQDIADDHLKALIQAGFIEQTGKDTYCIYDTLAQYARSLLKREPPSEYDRAYGRYVGLIINLVRLLRSMSVEQWHELLTLDVQQVVAFGDKLVAEWRKGDLSIATQELITQFMDDVTVFVLTQQPPQHLSWLEMGLDVAQCGQDIHRQAFFLDRISLYHYLHHDYDTALTYLHQAVDLHRQHQAAQLVAIAQSRIGLIYSEKQDHDQALNYYQHALDHFRAHNDEQNILDVLISMSKVYYQRQQIDLFRQVNDEIITIYRGRGDKSSEAFHHSLMIHTYEDTHDSATIMPHIDRTVELYGELNDTANLARAYDNLGVVLQALGETDRAITSFSQAAMLYAQLDDNPHAELNTLKSLIVLLRRSERSRETFPHFKRAFQLLDRVKDLNEHMHMHLNFGATMILLNQPDRALNTLLHAYGISLILGDSTMPIRKLIMMNVAIAYAQNDEMEQANITLEQLLAIHVQEEDLAEQVRVLDKLAQNYVVMKDRANAEAYFARALQICQMTANTSDELVIYRHMVEMYHRFKAWTEIIAIVNKALPLAEHLRLLSDVAAMKNDMAVALTNLGDFITPIGLYEESLAIYLANHDADNARLTLENLGRAWERRADIKRAITCWQQSLAIVSQNQTTSQRADAYYHLGELYRNLMDWEQARQMYEQALPLYQQTNNRTQILYTRQRWTVCMRELRQYDIVIQTIYEIISLAISLCRFDIEARLYVQLAKTYDKMHYFSSAIGYIKLALDTFPIKGAEYTECKQLLRRLRWRRFWSRRFNRRQRQHNA